MIEDTRQPDYREDFVCERCGLELTEDEVVCLDNLFGHGGDIQVCENCEKDLIKDELDECCLNWKQHRDLLPEWDNQKMVDKYAPKPQPRPDWQVIRIIENYPNLTNQDSFYPNSAGVNSDQFGLN